MSARAELGQDDVVESLCLSSGCRTATVRWVSRQAPDARDFESLTQKAGSQDVEGGRLPPAGRHRAGAVLHGDGELRWREDRAQGFRAIDRRGRAVRITQLVGR
jgi:hypothetical protein